LNKEIHRFKMELPNQQLEFDLKVDEIARLKKELTELAECRERSYASEQKLESQVKKTQRMKDKLIQLQTEINSSINGGSGGGGGGGGFFAKQSLGASETYESIIDNLKFIIQEQLALRSSSSQNETTELKFKVSNCLFLWGKLKIFGEAFAILKINEIQTKLKEEKFLNEALECRLKLANKDKQELRGLLFSNKQKLRDEK
jgi:hypothetical protein